MPNPIDVTISWDANTDNGVPSQNPIPVPKGNGATVIQWTCGTGVQSFAITGLDSSVFNPSSSNGQVTSFSTTDANRDTSKTDYSYTITATHTTGRVRQHDPKIENGS